MLNDRNQDIKPSHFSHYPESIGWMPGIQPPAGCCGYQPEFCHLLLDNPELALKIGSRRKLFFTEEDATLSCLSVPIRWPILPTSLHELLMSIYRYV